MNCLAENLSNKRKDDISKSCLRELREYVRFAPLTERFAAAPKNKRNIGINPDRDSSSDGNSPNSSSGSLSRTSWGDSMIIETDKRDQPLFDIFDTILHINDKVKLTASVIDIASAFKRHGFKGSNDIKMLKNRQSLWFKELKGQLNLSDRIIILNAIETFSF